MNYGQSFIVHDIDKPPTVDKIESNNKLSKPSKAKVLSAVENAGEMSQCSEAIVE